MADAGNANREHGQRKFTADAPGYRNGFTATPNAVLMSGDLSGNAKTLYAIMLHAVWADAEPEMDELGALLGGGLKTARTALRELENARLVTSKRRGQGRTNAYVVHAPGEAQTVPEGQSRPALRATPLLEDVEEDTEVESKLSTSGDGQIKTSRKRRPVFDAIAEATNANPSASGGQIGKAEKAIRQASEPEISVRVHQALAAQPELSEIPRERIDAYLVELVKARAARYRELRPDWELTPTALASHWLRIPTWTARSEQARDAGEQAWQRVISRPHADLTDRERAALKAIGGSFTIRTSTHLPTTRRQFIGAWDDLGDR